MNTKAIRRAAISVAIGIAVAMPGAAYADNAVGTWSGESAAPVPHIPGTFAGSPTNDDPNTGQFTIAIGPSGLGRPGRAPEPPPTIDVTPFEYLGRLEPHPGDSAATESAFAAFRTQLRALATERISLVGRRRPQ